MLGVGRRALSFARPLAAAMVIAAAPVAGFASAMQPGSFLREGEEVEPPRAYTELCNRRAEICPDRHLRSEIAPIRSQIAQMFGSETLGLERVKLTSARLRQINAVNHTVNSMIRPVADRGPDLWTVTSIAGDCEEYVLAKMNVLASLGFPRSAMRIAVVRDGQGFHAVLVVETSRGGFVLDNMVSDVRTVRDSGYQFVVAESINRPGAWVRVSN